MSDLTLVERTKLERLLSMEMGYVSNFSNRTIGDFVAETAGIDIYQSKYAVAGESKANRLRTFWKEEPNEVAGRLILALVDYVEANDTYNWDKELGQECRATGSRLAGGVAGIDIAVFQPNRPGEGFELCAKAVRQSIQNREFREGLDRLHNFTTDYIRTLCQEIGIEVGEKSLNALFAEYVKTLRGRGKLQSDMTDQILKMSIAALDKFNHVRNDQSLAHPNEILNYDESILIFNYVTATIRFLESLK